MEGILQDLLIPTNTHSKEEAEPEDVRLDSPITGAEVECDDCFPVTLNEHHSLDFWKLSCFIKRNLNYSLVSVSTTLGLDSPDPNILVHE